MSTQGHERRKHKRFPVIQDLAEPVELTVLSSQTNGHPQEIPGVLTNLSAGGMVLVLMGTIEGKPTLSLVMNLHELGRLEVEGNVVWIRYKGATSVVGIQFTKIAPEKAAQINKMAEAHWERENKVQATARG